MNVGEIVRLKVGFRPQALIGRVYWFGVVQSFTPEEVILCLYDPQTQEVYQDEMGHIGLYSFGLTEVWPIGLKGEQQAS